MQLVVIGLAFSSLARAQVVRGRVLSRDSLTPAVGIVITAFGPDGKPAGSALSSERGDYSLRLLQPGRYRFRALQIGFRPTVIESIDVGPRQTLVRDIVLDGLPVVIAAVQVRERSACDMSNSDADVFLQLWDQARAALTATRLSEEEGTLDIDVVTVSGHVDAVEYGRAMGSKWATEAHPEVDTARAREMVVDRAFATTAPETLLAAGYVRRRENGTVMWDAPNAEVLLSDGFAAMHCFQLAPPSPEHPDWVGIGLGPQQTRDTVVDIRGVVWLERTTAELRRIDFDYTNLPPVNLRLCDPEPDPDSGASGRPQCGFFTNERSRLGLGGQLNFRRLATGEWIVSDWTIRTPPDRVKLRRSGIKLRQVGRSGNEKCFYGKDCRDLWAEWPRLVTEAGTVHQVARSGVVIYRNDTTLALANVAAVKQAGNHPARLVGIITDAMRRPLANAIVQIGTPGRAAVTSQAGLFEVSKLPPTTVSATVRCRGYITTQFNVLLFADSARQVSLALPADTSGAASQDCSGRRSASSGQLPQR